MSTAALFVEALDTAITLAHALIGWLIFLAVVATILILAAIATGAWAVDAVRRHAPQPSWRRDRPGARRYARTRARAPRARTAPRVPSWADTDHHRYEEAA